MSDQKPSDARITVVEALRRVMTAIQSNDEKQRFPDRKFIALSTTLRDINEHWVENKPQGGVVQLISGKKLAADQVKDSFIAFCNAAAVSPRNLHNPWGAAPYSGAGRDDFEYDISFHDFQTWSQPYLEKSNASVNTLPLPMQADTSPAHVHTLQRRNSVLAAEIKKAQAVAADPNDANSVFAELVKLSESRFGCLLGIDEDAVKYRIGDTVKFFRKSALTSRFARDKKREAIALTVAKGR